MEFLYTARATFDRTYDKGETYCNRDGKSCGQKSWDGYIEWSKFFHLSEVVSLDKMINEPLVVPDYHDEDDWNFIHVDGGWQTSFYTSVDYVLKRIKQQRRFNLLTVVLRPDREYNNIDVEGYEFVGYDLFDKEFGNSALTNCGGFDETFSPSDLNDKGLIDDFVKAYDIKKRLLENNPNEHHADTNVIAIWRHNVIGR